ncbi:MAG: DNA recombination protein RmuC [Clostridia bacterium]|nr:DNA recombination protein RmuC [Clostridia bacterium]
MLALIESHPLPFMMLACVLCSLATSAVLLYRMKKMQRILRGRIAENERRTQSQQAQLIESINSVLQMSAIGTQNAEQHTRELADRLDARMSALLQHNEKQLTDMRELVDKQLTGVLEKRLGQSFQQVSRQLEQVYRGLGEMQNLASGVGDLKRVLQGVKTRGVWGEIQLGSLLQQMLTEAQYEENVAVVPGSQERVEFAIRLPGRDGEGLYLPIDSKFPMDAFQHLIDAADTGDKAQTERAAADLSRAVSEQAKKITQKYIRTPYTTDFAIMFLPVESLYAEVLRRPGLAESIQEKYRVVISGPTTLSALLNSLQMGFKTLTIEQRTGEVWQTLGTLKVEFARFGDTLDRMRQRLDQATGELDAATTRSRAITRKLNELSDPNQPKT